MFQKFGKDIPQALIDAVSGIMSEAKADEMPPIDKDAAAARKARQARLDAIEDAKAEKESGEKKPSSVRTVAGKAYGGSKQKDEPEQQDESHEVDESGLRMAAHAAHKAGQKNFEFQGKTYPVKVTEDGKVDCNYSKVKDIAKKEVQGHEKRMHEGTLTEKSVSIAQQKFMGMVNAVKKGKMKAPSKEVRKAAHSMTKKAAHDFAATKHKGLPQHKEDLSANLMNKRQQQYNQAEELELHLDLTEGKKKELDLPFTPDKPHAPIAKPGKGGYGPSAARHLARLGLKGVKKESMMGKASSNADGLGESRGHKILATKLRQIAAQSHGMAPEMSTTAQNIKDKLKDADNLKGVEIVTQKDTGIKEDFHPNVHAELKKHSGKIGAIMHNTKDNAIAAVVHHPDAEGIHGPHHVHFFINDKKVHTSVHPTFGDAEQHAVHTVTSKSGLKHLSKMHNLMEEQIDELSKKTLGSYKDKAEKSASKSFDLATNAGKRGDMSRFAKHAVTLSKRTKGIDTAVKKLAREESVNELSKPMLATYIRRASDPLHPKSNVNLASRAADKLAKGGEDDGEADDRKAYKRSRGIGLAAAKMAREDSKSPGQDEDDHMSPGATARN